MSDKALGMVTAIDALTLDKEMGPGQAAFETITFVNKGKTDSRVRYWPGDTLMYLLKYQALKMTVKTIGDDDYLFVEAGGFSTRNPKGWQSPLYVMKRAGK